MSALHPHAVNATSNLNSNSESESNHTDDDRTFSNGIGMYTDAAKQRFNDVKQRVTTTVTDMYANVSQRVQTGTEAVQPTINDTVSTVKSTVGDISQRANTTVSNLTNQATATATNTAASVKSMASGGRTGGNDMPDRAELQQENNKLPKQNEISYGSAYANSKSITNNTDDERTVSRTTADVHDSKPNIKLNNTNGTVSAAQSSSTDEQAASDKTPATSDNSVNNGRSDAPSAFVPNAAGNGQKRAGQPAKQAAANGTAASNTPTRTKQHYSRDSDTDDNRSGGSNPSADMKTGDREGAQTNHGQTNNVIERTKKQSPHLTTNHAKNESEISSQSKSEESPPKNKQNVPNSMVLKSAL